mgnify:CR=1 FL=1
MLSFLINPTLLTIIQTGICLPKAQVTETNNQIINYNYGLVPLNEDGSIDVKLSEESVDAIKPPAIMDINLKSVRGGLVGRYGPDANGLYAIATGVYTK